MDLTPYYEAAKDVCSSLELDPDELHDGRPRWMHYAQRMHETVLMQESMRRLGPKELPAA